MMNEKFNNDRELQLAWDKLVNTNTNTLKKDFIINSINSKSTLSIMEIKTKFKKEIIMQLVAFSLLLYFSVTGIIHNSKHIENETSVTFFIAILIFILIFQGILIIRQITTFFKLKRWKIDSSQTFNQLSYNYNILKSYLSFDKYWSSISIFIGTYLIFSSYAHNGNHKFSMIYVFALALLSFALSFYVIAIKNKRKYGEELNNIRLLINNEV